MRPPSPPARADTPGSPARGCRCRRPGSRGTASRCSVRRLSRQGRSRSSRSRVGTIMLARGGGSGSGCATRDERRPARRRGRPRRGRAGRGGARTTVAMHGSPPPRPFRGASAWARLPRAGPTGSPAGGRSRAGRSRSAMRSAASSAGSAGSAPAMSEGRAPAGQDRAEIVEGREPVGDRRPAAAAATPGRPAEPAPARRRRRRAGRDRPRRPRRSARRAPATSSAVADQHADVGASRLRRRAGGKRSRMPGGRASRWSIPTSAASFWRARRRLPVSRAQRIAAASPGVRRTAQGGGQPAQDAAGPRYRPPLAPGRMSFQILAEGRERQGGMIERIVADHVAPALGEARGLLLEPGALGTRRTGRG